MTAPIEDPAPVRYTYTLMLVALDDDAAKFTTDLGEELPTLMFPREQWKRLGRPSALQITPEPTGATR